ncbi:hypothetical protein MATL_G00224840 [Megalops atlanticus]|uniref:Uncharacterized protein n=1 Tax=Megalops atlanticus TaxID=7932 RepID=A0A9D3PFI5_MEGAT|nr:hypothetical protein MATL_G00224840 [Megalops atlanticus]
MITPDIEREPHQSHKQWSCHVPVTQGSEPITSACFGDQCYFDWLILINDSHVIAPPVTSFITTHSAITTGNALQVNLGSKASNHHGGLLSDLWKACLFW